MKNIREIFEDTLTKNHECGYDTLYVALDVHGTIFKPSKKTMLEYGDGAEKPSEVVYNIGVRDEFEFYPDAEECLQILSANPKVKLLLWTSTYWQANTLRLLKEHGIEIYAINGNRDFSHSKYADFSTKFFFDILLDDKAGFDAEHDWTELLKLLKDMKRNEYLDKMLGNNDNQERF